MLKTMLALALAAAIGGAASAAEPTLKFGAAAEPYPPFTTPEASGKWVGFEVDLMDAVCAEMQRKCEMVGVAWDGIIPSLNSKKIDVIWSSMSITAERAKQIDFTSKYYKTPAELIGPKSAGGKIDFKTLDGIKGKTIAVQISTTHNRYAEKYFGKSATLKTYDTQDNANSDLIAGRVDLAMADSTALDEFLRSDQGKDYEVKGIAPDDAEVLGNGVGGGVRKSDTALKESLNKAIAAIRANGTYDKIAKKYFAFDVYGS